MELKILVVEDEPIAVQRITRLISQDARGKVVAVASSVAEAKQLLQKHSPDVIFLDIRLPDGTGLDLAKEVLLLGLKPYIIFTTAYGEYALDAFRVNAVDYLLKPFSLEDLQKALDKVVEKKSNTNQVINFIKAEKPLIPARIGNKIIFINPHEVFYVQAEMGEVTVRTKDGSLPLSKKLYELEEQLRPYNFFRVHRSYLINLSKVKEMKSVEQSKYAIQFKEINETIKTSREGAKALRDYLNL
ncbi:MAG: LytTR family DNA-binding domain-containing protein [Aquificaceae bacterium]